MRENMFRASRITLRARVLSCLVLVGTNGFCLGEGPRRDVSLTLIPPSPITDQIALDIRAAVWNHGDKEEAFEVSIYLDQENPEHRLHRQNMRAPAGQARLCRTAWPAKGRAGKHRIILVAQSPAQVVRAERPIEVLATGQRSTRRLGGAWVDIYHHDEREGKPFNAELARMTASDWRELVAAMHESGQDVLVITMMFQNFTHRGRHRIETDGYGGKAYYPSKLFPARMPVACDDPLEAILTEADRLGMHVLPGVGNYAFFDYTPASLRWCKQVAAELWERYGHHPSFYGWYLSHEKTGSLGSQAEREEIVAFFAEFTPFVRALAPDKPVLLAPNSFGYGSEGAVEAYKRLLPHLDIICPFGYHRMPGRDLSGEQAAELMQKLCDQAGCHLWMDLESFVFGPGSSLVPRPIDDLVSDFTRFGNFEKILHYQFPGLMSSPKMARQPGGPASVKLYEDYLRYLREGPPKGLEHAALNKPVSLAAPPDVRYPGRGAKGLVDGLRASDNYRHPQWLGWYGNDLEATIDLGRPTDVKAVAVRCLQCVPSGIYLPVRVHVSVSGDGKAFKEIATIQPTLPQNAPGPQVPILRADALTARGRYVRVRAVSIGTIPAGQPGGQTKAWLFADEVLVNPVD
ncbi:MAG: hypothetical protein BWX88_00512 [Planctomycetes bacterium ADurb.Bin126]|nr:MAG: hypothetical protein BWX88_00512 [Planctomycetes bacterium ADurb.Bin126]HOD82343.1 DUF4434 domain-containing protein [Phycisphaerae bacterium]HQL73616.1 DUF4434 domain-containing protein [Phycisphaerae bacterium]